ncbi:MAG: hypothetical protein HC887_07550 [Desulfobacteraceae bacterium]|nr:hypothetical protein [Desulfobacteraceae bacterium]
MSEAGEHLELLKNAVRQPIAALTAVETDTVYQAKELAKMLAAEIGERPNETLSMAVEDGAAALLYQARRISENWADDQSVLFVIDDGGKDAEKRYAVLGGNECAEGIVGCAELPCYFFSAAAELPDAASGGGSFGGLDIIEAADYA